VRVVGALLPEEPVLPLVRVDTGVLGLVLEALPLVRVASGAEEAMLAAVVPLAAVVTGGDSGAGAGAAAGTAPGAGGAAAGWLGCFGFTWRVRWITLVRTFGLVAASVWVVAVWPLFELAA